jgi:hypothetical protein
MLLWQEGGREYRGGLTLLGGNRADLPEKSRERPRTSDGEAAGTAASGGDRILGGNSGDGGERRRPDPRREQRRAEGTGGGDWMRAASTGVWTGRAASGGDRGRRRLDGNGGWTAAGQTLTLAAMPMERGDTGKMLFMASPGRRQYRFSWGPGKYKEWQYFRK